MLWRHKELDFGPLEDQTKAEHLRWLFFHVPLISMKSFEV
jgi:hypothetical protein